MDTEFEATFLNINKNEIKEKLIKSGAVLIRPEYLQKRIPFELPKETKSEHKWLRVRDEGNKITLSLKEVGGNKIEDQKELCLEINNFEDAVKLLRLIGCEQKSYQENKRELWKLDNVDITIDEWPFLDPFVEVEGKSENEVKIASEKIGFKYEEALFCSTSTIYSLKYNISLNQVNSTSKIIFDMPNPFI